ncbi:MAG: ribosome biogenesis GTP-binding protein YihA/YsxC [Candidatus Alcyoniella australis]|nr:ribosome biogenesis GTP-binding protein YihA/YsxC [Candidatus Alcyoniella australis]
MKPRLAEFIKSAAQPGDYPQPGPPEIAFAGRSNVGKSSLINGLLGRKKLAKVSQSPGKTRLINFFAIEGDRLRLVDLPGYGYAKVSKVERSSWRTMIERYIDQRETLAAVVLLTDSRRGLQDWEMGLMSWLADQGLPFLLTLTKVDKLKRNEIEKLKREMHGKFGLQPGDYALTSAAKGSGLPELWRRIETLALPPEIA